MRRRPLTRLRALPLAIAVLAVAACVPPDESLPLGGVSFEVRAGRRSRDGIRASSFGDRWDVRVDRALLSFKTVTIGQADDVDACAYRGRAERKNVVFDALAGNVQSFNGLLPNVCPDVGVIFGPPDDGTTPGAGATGADIVALAAGVPAHALLEATATKGDEAYRLNLRFDTARTSSRAAGCRDATRGVRIVPDARSVNAISFDVDAFFRAGLSRSAELLFAPYADADEDGDHVVTMDELDRLPLASLRIYSSFYTLGGASTFGAFVRAQFREAFSFREAGLCTGKLPGED
jgi:hypothetical protein